MRAFIIGAGLSAIAAVGFSCESVPSHLENIGLCGTNDTTIQTTYPGGQGYDQFFDPMVLVREQKRMLEENPRNLTEWGLGAVACHPEDDDAAFGPLPDISHEFLTRQGIELSAQMRQAAAERQTTDTPK